jgi:hypothetical protein
MKKMFIAYLLTLLILAGCKDEDNPPDVDNFERQPMVAEELSDCPVPTLDGGYSIVWDEEFNYNGLPDGSKWGYDLGTGNGGWGNRESQFYTNREENASVSDGYLTITALKEKYNTSEYTSARILTRNLGDWRYGRVEVRAKLPSGIGTWPAIWMMQPTAFTADGRKAVKLTSWKRLEPVRTRSWAHSTWKPIMAETAAEGPSIFLILQLNFMSTAWNGALMPSNFMLTTSWSPHIPIRNILATTTASGRLISVST